MCKAGVRKRKKISNEAARLGEYCESADLDGAITMLTLGSWRRSASTVARGFAYCASMALISALQQHPNSQCDGRPAREMPLGTTHKVRLLHSRHDSRHATLQLVARFDDEPQRQRPDRILVIGDVHGCYDEMIRLYEAAGAPEIVILVGDLVNKGPYSAQVVRHVRTTPGWFAVRGNHDDGALRVATMGGGLADEPGAAAAAANARQKYAWLYGGDDDANENIGSLPTRRCALSNDDLQWLADLPYTIRIPAATAATATADQKGHDIVVVHAGLVPGMPLEEQTNRTMVTLRTVVLVANEGQPPSYQYDESSGGDGVPWASVWTGPDFIIFGHDARRGLQRERYAIGLDTGACYGKRLTGILLPSKKIYQVDASQTYCPIGSED